MNAKKDNIKKVEAKKVPTHNIQAKKPFVSNNNTKKITKVEQKKTPAQVQPKKVINSKIEIKKDANVHKTENKKTPFVQKKFEVKKTGNNNAVTSKETPINKPKPKIVKH